MVQPPLSLVESLVPTETTDARCVRALVQELKLVRWGLDELRDRSLYAAIVAEGKYTALFMYLHIGICRAAKDAAWPALVSALGHTALISMLLMAAMSVSGAHINPNITIAMMLTRHCSVCRGLAYISSQVMGAIAGVLAMKATLGWDNVVALDLAPCDFGSLTSGGTFIAEFVLFFALLSVVSNVAQDAERAAAFGPATVACIIGSCVGVLIFAASGSGYGPGLNCAQCYSVAVVTGEFTGCEWYSFAGPFWASVLHSFLTSTTGGDAAPPSPDQRPTPLLARRDSPIGVEMKPLPEELAARRAHVP